MGGLLKPFRGKDGRRGFTFWCPGCKSIHSINTEGPPPVWGFNGDHEKPTFTPSLRVRWTYGGDPQCCHSFIRDGQWQFLSDCTHELAGKTVPMEPHPDA